MAIRTPPPITQLVLAVRAHARSQPDWYAQPVEDMGDLTMWEVIRTARTREQAIRLVAESLGLTTDRRVDRAASPCIVVHQDGSLETLAARDRVALADLVEDVEPPAPCKPLDTPTMWWVVSRSIADQMRGGRMPAPKGGRVYGVFATPEAADECFDALPHGQLYATIVRI